jgi:hypothetical protein
MAGQRFLEGIGNREFHRALQSFFSSSGEGHLPAIAGTEAIVGNAAEAVSLSPLERD